MTETTTKTKMSTKTKVLIAVAILAAAGGLAFIIAPKIDTTEWGLPAGTVIKK